MGIMTMGMRMEDKKSLVVSWGVCKKQQWMSSHRREHTVRANTQEEKRGLDFTSQKMREQRNDSVRVSIFFVQYKFSVFFFLLSRSRILDFFLSEKQKCEFMKSYFCSILFLFLCIFQSFAVFSDLFFILGKKN